MSKTAKKIASWFKSFNQKCDKTKQDGIVVKFWNAISEEGRDKARNEMADLIQCTIEKDKDCSLVQSGCRDREAYLKLAEEIFQRFSPQNLDKVIKTLEKKKEQEGLDKKEEQRLKRRKRQRQKMKTVTMNRVNSWSRKSEELKF